jgi:hypothetical protein
MAQAGDVPPHHQWHPFNAMNVGVDVTDDRWSR